MTKPNDTHAAGASTFPTNNTGLTSPQEAPAGVLIGPTGDLVDDTFPLATQSRAATSALTNVSGSATSVQILAANSSRKQATFFNDSTADCYLKFGTTASSTSFTVKIPAGGYYELPAPVYTGRIDAIWSAANGALRVTELTA